MVINVECPIANFLSERIDAGDFPSAVYLVAEKGNVVLSGALGYAVVEHELLAASTETIFDLASLTKILCTAPILAKLVEERELDLEQRASSIIPELNTRDKRDLTIQELLTHTSRMPAWKPLYLTASTPGEVMNDIAQTPLIEGGNKVIYSDLNFITLGRVVERITDATLDVAFQKLIGSPLGLQNTGFNPNTGLRIRIAANENGNEYERQMCVEKGYLDESTPDTRTFRFRNDVIWGEVHDGNAYFMNGVAGHAGLFSTAREVFQIADQFLPGRSELFNAETCELFRTNMTPGANEHRSFGFQLASTTDSTAGVNMPPQSFGHLGFTGTSLWIDPVNERVFILLTNRTHHHSLPFVLINSVRRKFHDLAIEFLDKNR